MKRQIRNGSDVVARLIIAEKPSVAKNIAEALGVKKRNDGYFEGEDYLITWAFGHLLQLYDAKDYKEEMARWKISQYPFIPDEFKYKVKSSQGDRSQVDEGAKKQIEVIRHLAERDDVDGVISACDYDREGQVIGDIIIQYIGVKKPVYRLLLNEWTADEVVRGMEKLKGNDEMKPLQDSGISRQWADWTIGINLTSVASLKYQRGRGGPLNIGRVLLPTLKIIYDRDNEIEKFVPDTFYRLQTILKTDNGEEFKGIYTQGKDEKFKDKKVLDEVLSCVKNSGGAVVMDKQIEKKKDYPPYLFNLSNLQGFVTSKYKGWTSDKVLKVAQSLYEKKFITYPRTSSVVLEESLEGRAKKVLGILKKGLPYEAEIQFRVTKRNFDNSKVESHSAIVPTYMVPKSLTADEKIVYTAVKNRFIAQFMPLCEYEETKIYTGVNGVELEGSFVSKGKVLINEGWKKAEGVETKEAELPLVDIEEKLEFKSPKVITSSTKPPKHHTEKTLLRVMETCGKKFDDEESGEIMDAVLSGFSIGTPATRAETIKKLKDIGYISAKGKNLICTETGKKLVEKFPIKELFDLGYTGRLEKTLSEIEKGKFKKQDFLDLIYEFTRNSVERIKDGEAVIIKSSSDYGNHESLGKCPACGSDIIEGQKGFGCSNWKGGCKFVIWKDDKYLAALGKKPTKAMVKKLLKDGRVKGIGFKSKRGNTFDAYIRYVKSEKDEYFKWEMEFI